MREITPEDYGLSKGAIWFHQMREEGWILGGPELNLQKCLDTVALVEETDTLYPTDIDEDEMQVAMQMLTGCLDEALDGDFDAAVQMACEFIAEKYGPVKQ